MRTERRARSDIKQPRLRSVPRRDVLLPLFPRPSTSTAISGIGEGVYALDMDASNTSRAKGVHGYISHTWRAYDSNRVERRSRTCTTGHREGCADAGTREAGRGRRRCWKISIIVDVGEACTGQYSPRRRAAREKARASHYSAATTRSGLTGLGGKLMRCPCAEGTARALDSAAA